MQFNNATKQIFLNTPNNTVHCLWKRSYIVKVKNMHGNDAITLEYHLTLGRMGGKERDGPEL